MIEMTRRQLMAGGASALAAALIRPRGAAAQRTSAGPADPQVIEDPGGGEPTLVRPGGVGGYGHPRARHARDPNRFLMSRSLAPELVTAPDIMEYDLDAEPVDARGRS